MSRLRQGLVVAALLMSAGCPDGSGTVTSTIDRWHFTMGHRGSGYVFFQAEGPEGSHQSGECRDLMCPSTVDDLTIVKLQPVAGEGSRFMMWNGDPASNLACPVTTPPNATGTIIATVSSDAACIAIFEAATTIPPPTTPGVSQAAGGK